MSTLPTPIVPPKGFYQLLDEQAATACENAADLLERSEWIQGSYFSPALLEEPTGFCSPALLEEPTGFCLMGAVVHVSGANLGTPLINRIEIATVKQIKERGQLLFPPVPQTWNDQPERTKQEVLDVLRGAAKDLRARAEGIQ